MKSKSAEKIKLTSYDDLFGSSEVTAEEKIVSVPIRLFHTFKDHPFRVLDDEKMQETVESVKRYGILMPGIVRPYGDGEYEMVAGHRRWRACELAGMEEMPVIIREMDDDTATVIMVDTNIQREDILPSEKAHAYKMKYEAMKHQGSKGEKHTADLVGEAAGESGRTVQRYIRLSFLISRLLDYVDKTEKAAQEEIEEARHSLSASDGKEPEPKISFYVAECTEFHILGEYHEDLSLQEAAELYQTIPADRMNGIKGIGFRLEDGSIYDGTYELMTAGKMQTEFINEIPHYRDSPLVQQAIVDMEKILDKWKEKELTEPEKEKPLELEKTAEKAPKADIQTAKGKGKKQSVLQALRERQAKLKAQETGQTEQKTQGRRKGEPEL